jgi:hypothetical protein
MEKNPRSSVMSVTIELFFGETGIRVRGGKVTRLMILLFSLLSAGITGTYHNT